VKVLIPGAIQPADWVKTEEGWSTKDVVLIQQLDHPNIMTVYGTGVADGMYFQAMEFLSLDLFNWYITRE
jgi:hypothetical protein